MLEAQCGTRWGLTQATLPHCREHLGGGCAGAPWGHGYGSCPLLPRGCLLSCAHQSILLLIFLQMLTMQVSVFLCRPIHIIFLYWTSIKEKCLVIFLQTYLLQHVWLISVHVSFACNIMSIYTVTCSGTQLSGQMPNLWADVGIAYYGRESFYCSEKATVF